MDEIQGFFANITTTIAYYATEGIVIDKVALPAELLDRAADEAWPKGVTIVDSDDDLIRYFSAGVHIGTQRVA